MNRNDEDLTTTPATVAKATAPPQAGEAPARREPWWWVERRVWTQARLTRLASGESADRVWFRLGDKTFSGLPAVGCCPWQRNTSGRGQSQQGEPTDRRAGCGRPARPVRMEG